MNIFNDVFQGLIDTGAMISIIGRSIANCLRRNGVNSEEVTQPLQMANGFKTRVTQAYNFSCDLGGISTEVKALVVPTLTTDMVIGMDLINQLGLVTINYPRTGRGADIEQCPGISAVMELSPQEQQKLEKLLEQELPLFGGLLGRTALIEHTIRLKSNTPIKSKHYSLNPAMQRIVDEEINSMLADDVIEPSNSPYSSPIVLIKKPTGKYRFCCDLRKINSISEPDAYPLPKINAILDKLREAKYISTIDLKNGYWQVPLSEVSKPLTAFTVPGRGLYQFKVMPFGLHAAPATFQRLLDRVIGPELEPRAFAYLDDLVLATPTFEEHLELLRDVFQRLREANLKINPEKCQFCRTELRYLGHVINSQGVNTDPEKVRAIVDFLQPKTVRQLRRFLGMASWYRRFVPNFAKCSAPLTKLLKKNTTWQWGQSQETAFKTLKEKLTTSPTLVCPDFNLPFELHTDASNEGLGAALVQKQNNKEVVIAFASRLLADSEKKFTVTEKECLSVVWSVRKFRPYLEGYHFKVVTDHQSLKWLMKLQEPSGRLGRWILELQQHSFEICYRKGALNKVADALSRNPVSPPPDPEGEETNLSNEYAINVIAGTQKSSNLTPRERSLDWYTRMYNKVVNRPNKYDSYTISREGKLLKRVRPNRRMDMVDPTTVWKTCVPSHLRDEVLKENHDRAESGHFGVRKTLKRVGSRYYWLGWQKQVKAYVRRCVNCQQYKVEQKKPVGKMILRRPRGPWYMITLDLIGPLPRSKRGSKFALVVQDNFSKWVEVAPLKSATAKQVVDQLTSMVLLRYGAPEVIRCDNGSQFTSKIFQDLAREWQIKLEFTAPYSPQSNPTERYNRVLKTMIAQYVKDDHRTWDQNLAEFRFAMNSAVHDSTKFSPAMITLGRELRLPRAIHGALVTEKVEVTEEEEYTAREILSKRIHEKVKENLAKAFAHQARFYNLRRRENPFQIGQEVLKRQHTPSSAIEAIAQKLTPKYDGPFTIQRQVGANMFELVDHLNNVHVVHAKDLKAFQY